MRIKILYLFAIGFTAVAGIFVWRLDRSLFEDRLVWNEAQLKNQMATLDVSLASFINQLKSEAQLLEPDRAASREFKKDFITSENREPAWLMYSKLENSEEGWKALATTTLEGSQVQPWALKYSLESLKSVKAQDILNHGHFFMTVLDPQRKSYLLFAWPVSNGEFGLALFRPLILQSIVDSQKGQWAQAILANTQGQIIAHSEPDYVATRITDDPLLGPIMKNENQFNSVIAKDSEGTAFQFISDHMTRTNMRIIFQTPVADLLAGRSSMMWQNLSLALGLMLIGSALIFLLFPKENEIIRQQTLSGVAAVTPNTATRSGLTNTGSTASAGTGSGVKSGAPAVQKEIVYQTVAPQTSQPDITHLLRSIVREVSEPLHAILSRVQLLKSHDDSVAYAGQIEEEVRKSRDLLNLLDFSTLNDKSLSNPGIKKYSVPFAEHLKNWLEAKKIILEAAGIRLQTGIETDFVIEMDPFVFNLALDQIFYNAVESMQNQTRKEMVLKLFKKDDQFQLSLQDTGEGIPDRNMQQIFNPFFTSRQNQKPAQSQTLKNRGLGLPAAVGVFNFHHVKLEISSQIMKGTTVTLTFNEVLSQSIVAGESTSIYRVNENKSVNDRTTFKLPGAASPTAIQPAAPQPAAPQPAASESAAVPPVFMKQRTPEEPEMPVMDLLESDPEKPVAENPFLQMKSEDSLPADTQPIIDVSVDTFVRALADPQPAVENETTTTEEIIVGPSAATPQPAASTSSKGGLDGLLKKKAGLLFGHKSRSQTPVKTADEKPVEKTTMQAPVLTSEIEGILDEDPFSEKSSFISSSNDGAPPLPTVNQDDRDAEPDDEFTMALLPSVAEEMAEKKSARQNEVVQLDAQKKAGKMDHFQVMVRKPRKNNDHSPKPGGTT